MVVVVVAIVVVVTVTYNAARFASPSCYLVAEGQQLTTTKLTTT